VEIALSILAFVFVIGVMILVHEWGHFIAAKRLGIEVEVFSIGFGPKLFSWKRGETEYRICLLPVGGYVKMLAENPDEGTTGDPREFLSRARWERFIVLVMGAVFNILLAFLIWTAVLMIGEPKEKWLTEPARAVYIAPGGPADRAGVREGDVVAAFNGQPMADWEELLYAVATHPREEVEIRVLRGSGELSFRMRPYEDESSGIGSIGIGPGYPAVIAGVQEGMPAAEAGLRDGDVVEAINGLPVSSYYDIFDEVTRRTRLGHAMGVWRDASPLAAPLERLLDVAHTLEFTVRREGISFDVALSPEFDPEAGFRRIGIVRPPMEQVAVGVGPLEAVGGALERCLTTSGRLFDILARMITGRLSTRAVSGPVEIAAISGRTAEQGVMPFLNLIAFISLNLGIINLLPLPVLDGGGILILVIEGTARRDLSLKAKEWIMRVGVVLLLLLMALVIYQDIDKLIMRMG